MVLFQEDQGPGWSGAEVREGAAIEEGGLQGDRRWCSVRDPEPKYEGRRDSMRGVGGVWERAAWRRGRRGLCKREPRSDPKFAESVYKQFINVYKLFITFGVREELFINRAVYKHVYKRLFISPVHKHRTLVS